MNHSSYRYLQMIDLLCRIITKKQWMETRQRLVYFQAKLKLLKYIEEQLLHNKSDQDLLIRRALKQKLFGLPFHDHYDYNLIVRDLVNEKKQHY